VFTGIIESMGTLVNAQAEQENLVVTIHAPLAHELHVDQSVSHNGVCLTVTEINGDEYKVCAIAETLRRSNLGRLKRADLINLERCMKADGRFDGHIVQGHVDDVASVTNFSDESGSYLYHFRLNDPNQQKLLVEKGSVCVNGVSLTVVDCSNDMFSVAIIPYTFEHTNFKNLQPGHLVNLEFDIVGKYIRKMLGKDA
jgi:riboflavin synthase